MEKFLQNSLLEDRFGVFLAVDLNLRLMRGDFTKEDCLSLSSFYVCRLLETVLFITLLEPFSKIVSMWFATDRPFSVPAFVDEMRTLEEFVV